ncbi:MAG: aminotransferase class I/II-fold pyridoxal phosphate-dependent enzyme, partial [Acidimicrobiia bacterium]|nr:aminotransferase class I/II-fold pyridoxal phosphate-dependent enzyme [Acidimicrobiia bacterium]
MSEGSGSVGFDGLLRQGGDPRARAASVSVDLSTCVCRYGPPAAAVEAFAALGPEQLREHPYRAAAALTAAYAEYLDVEPGRLVVGRGASEFIWRLARSPLADRVAVPLPAYTEYVLAFPGANRGGPGAARSGVHHGLAEIDALLGEGRVVLISNPHNPSGRALPADELAAVAQANSAGLLVVDESYVEFVAEPERFTLVGRAGANVVVLRSPSKFFGLAGCR